MPRCTSARVPDSHTWPPCRNVPHRTAAAAWSRSASSRTMLADLPPSSSVTGFTLPDASCMMRRPTSVEPVKAVLSTIMLEASSSPSVPPGPAEDVDHARRQVDLGDQLGQLERGERGERRRLEHRAVAGGDRRGDLPGGHQQGEVPRHDAGGHADRLVADVVAATRGRASPRDRPGRARSRRTGRTTRTRPGRRGCRRAWPCGWCRRRRGPRARPARRRWPRWPRRSGGAWRRARRRSASATAPRRRPCGRRRWP